MKKIYLEYIGAITVSFNTLETWIKNSVAELLDKNDINKGLMICNEFFPIGRLLELYTRLFKYKITDTEANKLFDRFMKSCKEVTERRNTLIHSIYLPDVGLQQKANEVNVETISIKFKKDKHIAEILSVDFFEKIHEKIESTLKLHNDLNDFLINKGFIEKKKK